MEKFFCIVEPVSAVVTQVCGETRSVCVLYVKPCHLTSHNFVINMDKLFSFSLSTSLEFLRLRFILIFLVACIFLYPYTTVVVPRYEGFGSLFLAWFYNLTVSAVCHTFHEAEYHIEKTLMTFMIFLKVN